MNIYSIYKITNNINKKLYIGFTSNNIQRRFKDHIRKSSTGRNALYCAMRKYGIKNFFIEPIYQSYEMKYTLTKMEPYFINEYNTHYGPGYNMSKGGEGTPHIERKSSHMKGKTHSEETKQKISKSKKGQGLGIKSWNSGQKMSNEWKANHKKGLEKFKKNNPEQWSKNWKKARLAAESNRLKAISREVMINNVKYSSARDAFRKLNNINYTTLIKRIESKNFSNFVWLK